MYKENNKYYLYDLIDKYLADKVDEVALCNGMYYSYVQEIDYSLLNDIEIKAFSKLEEVTRRFSEFEEDHKLDSKAFATKEEVRHAAMETKKMLQDQWPDVLL